jgi:hypothetical protein
LIAAFCLTAVGLAAPTADAEFVITCSYSICLHANPCSLVPSPIYLSVVDHEGNDMNHLFATHHRNSTVGKLEKRANHIITCGETILSYCDRSVSPRAWRCLGFQEPKHILDWSEGSCAETQICIDPPAGSGVGKANCGDLEGFASIAATLGAKIKKNPSIGKTYRGPTGSAGADHGVDTVFMNSRLTAGLPMKEIIVTAQSSQISGTWEAWHNLDSRRCTNCYSLPFYGVPAHTSRFLVQGIMYPESPGGRLYVDTL